MTPNGKVDRRALAQATAEEAPTKRAAGGGARTPFERELLTLLGTVLEQENIHVEDNFFELGANSLLLARVHERLEKTLERAIPMVDLFNHPTIRSLAAHLGDDDRPATRKVDEDRWSGALKRGRDRLRRRAGGGQRKMS